MNLKTLSSEGKIAYLIKPILKVLQEAGGQLERSEIKERIADMDDQIAEYSVLEKKSKQTGNTYKEFNFKFNFAIKDLYFNDLLTYDVTFMLLKILREAIINLSLCVNIAEEPKREASKDKVIMPISLMDYEDDWKI